MKEFFLIKALAIMDKFILKIFILLAILSFSYSLSAITIQSTFFNCPSYKDFMKKGTELKISGTAQQKWEWRQYRKWTATEWNANLEIKENTPLNVKIDFNDFRRGQPQCVYGEYLTVALKDGVVDLSKLQSFSPDMTGQYVCRTTAALPEVCRFALL